MKQKKLNRAAPKAVSSRRSRVKRTLFLSLLLSLCVIAVGAGGVLFSNKVPKADAAAQDSDGISPEGLAQIDALIRDKESRTEVQKKIDSQLIYQLKMSRGQILAEGVDTLETDVKIDDQGKAAVDITADVSDELLNNLQAAGAEIISSVPERNSIRALVPLDGMEAIAAAEDVKFIQPKQEAMHSGFEAPEVDARSGFHAHVLPGFGDRAARVLSFLPTVLQDGAQSNVIGIPALTGVGSRSSEGDVTHRANLVRGVFHADGTGIKIGVLSDGVTNLAASQALGDLGPVTVLPGQAGLGDEGTAMLEIIHDVAPGAQLYFATADGGITNFAQNIRNLRTAGCDIIVDDVFYFVETPFQDGQLVATNTNGGVVIQAVNDVTAAGALYFSSAGNEGNVDQGTAGVWEGDFVDGGPTALPLPAGSLHNFGPQNFDVLTVLSGPIALYWSDPLGGSGNDYDLFRLNSTGTTVLASSTNIQNGTQDPFEQVSPGTTAGVRLVIVKKTGSADRFLHLNTNRGRLSLATTGQTHGHSAAADAYSCAATPAVGPYPNPFNSGNVTETFSSDGPRRLFFKPDGMPFTPGNFSSTGGILRQKPDITAADGVSVTGVGGFGSPFFGTSAAAPHAAAIAGLLKSANPALTPAQIRTSLTSTAIDIMTPGVDRTSGAGIIDAYSATQSLGIAGTAFLQLGTITANEDPGDGNGSIDAGESASMVIQLRNDGVNNATAISATLASSTPGVTIIPPITSSYPDLAAGGGSGNNLTLFRFSLASFVSCPTLINFKLTINYTGGPSQVLNFTVLSQAPTNISSTLDLVPPAPGPGFTATTGALNIRHFRNGVPSSCGSTKAFPGTSTPGNHQYDAYTFQTCPNSGPTCVTVTLSAANGVNLFSAAYSGSFNPADLSQNYLADAGFSNVTTSYSFNLPAGQQSFVVVVEDVPAGPASGSPYTLNVSGSCVGTCTEVPVIRSSDSTLVNESCPPANNAVDPGERVTVSLKLANIGNAPTSNLVATLQSNTGVVAPSNPQSYGVIAAGGNASRDFSFTALGNCGDLITATLKLQDGENDFAQVSYTFRLGSVDPVVPLSENLDGVTAPALPAGWTTSASGIEVLWVTSTTNPVSAPNDAFAPDVPNIGNTELVSPSVHILSAVAQLSFRNAYNLENAFDGGVLEISINGGPYQDIITAGGSFVSGGYNGVINASSGNPLAGRSAWTGLSGGTTTTPAYLNTVVNLPAATAGQDIQLKWRVGTDASVVAAGTVPGQRIDNITISDFNFVCTTPCGGVRLVTTSSLSRPDASTVVAEITVQNIGSVTADNVQLTGTTLGAINGTPLPQSLGNLPPGGIASVIVNFTNSTPGAASVLTLSGNYDGGPFGGLRRVTIP